MTEANDQAAYLEHAKALVEHIEAGDDEQVQQALESIAKIRESQLFLELGKLTRELHDAMNSFRMDTRLAELAEHEFPDAKERLNYVISMTEESAHKTLTAVEESLDMTEEMTSQAADIKKDWDRFTARQMSVEEFRDLSTRVDAFLALVTNDSSGLQGKLNDVLMAQSSQDLTGQIIRRVIELVQDVESGLVDMIRISGAAASPKSESPKDSGLTESGMPEAVGPAVPGVDSAEETVNNQDDVDDLLSSLGF